MARHERPKGGIAPISKPKFAWRKVSVVAAVLIGLVYFYGPREPKNLMKWVSGSHGTSVAKPIHDDELSDMLPPPHTVDPPPPQHLSHGGAHKTGTHKPPSTTQPVHITSFESDPDPSKTVYCTTPHNPNGHLVQYALMIEAGLTGSRIHIYKFNNCGASATYEYETFKGTRPSLLAYSAPERAASSLDVLMEEAMRVVPKDLRKCTPVAVKATTGLRRIGMKESVEILDAIRDRLHAKYPFALQEKDGVVVMDGKDEGVYTWITANQLLGAGAPRPSTPAGTAPLAVLDLGGGSAQIVFEPKLSNPDSSLAEGEHKYDLPLRGKTYILHQHSYLEYGLMRARKHVHQMVASLTTNDPDAVVINPCLAKWTTRIVQVNDEATGVSRIVTMAGEDVGGFEECHRIIERVMAKNKVYQPALPETSKLLLLSYFYDRISPLLTSHESRITVSTLAALARDICLGVPSWEANWGHNSNLLEELVARPEWCLELTFMYALLRLGYGLDDDREVTIGRAIEGIALTWPLGATLAMLSGPLTCRV